jgi:aryl sulfotransferase
MAGLPERTRIHQNHHLDGTRWEAYRPREGDIVIATSYKAGTTWTQGIVANLLFPDQRFPAPPWQMSPWLDHRLRPLEDVVSGLEAQRHRRFIKTHLSLDGLPYYPQVSYIFVSRDGRDVFMSLWNHYRNYTDEFRVRVGVHQPPRLSLRRAANSLGGSGLAM